jgi:excisionase family DNA binding protein
MDKLAYTVDEVAKATSFSPSTIKRAITRGELMAVRVGRRCAIRPEAVDAWLAANERQAS